MKNIKPANNDAARVFKGVSTLDFGSVRIILLLLAIGVCGGSIQAGHSILDRVDPAFDPEVGSAVYGGKNVHQLATLPDGKTLVFGNFSSYNRVPIGRFVRLNADGSLDPTFNNNIVTASDNSGGTGTQILVLPDGKIILAGRNIVAGGQAINSMLRLNSDGSIDSSFNYNIPSTVSSIAIDAAGRLLVRGNFSTLQGTRKIIRLSPNGAHDSSFNFTGTEDASVIAAQGNKVIVGRGNGRIFRLNENGSEDATFTVFSTTGLSVSDILVQSNNKILFQMATVRRMNENGDLDAGFTPISSGTIKLAGDDKIFVYGGFSPNPASFKRYLPDGTPDTAFNPYVPASYTCFAIHADGGIVIGDVTNLNSSVSNINNFARVTPAGFLDTAFNAGGIGFQNILPGSIRSIEPQANGKILLGGNFDAINNIQRTKLARLNADATLDSTFQINTSGSGNYFSIIRDVYQIHAQSDGKIIVSGWFDYFINGEAKRNLVRLNPDGSMDTTFMMAHSMPDYSEINGAGRNQFVVLSDGSVIVGTSRINGFGAPGPIKLTPTGAIDPSFNSAIYPVSSQIYIDDVELQPDGKVVVAGSHNTTQPFVSFVIRLNTDGSLDPTFNHSEEGGRLRAVLGVLPGGKILVATHSNGTGPARLIRRNADGTVDASYNPLTINTSIINALVDLPNGKIFVGGRFSVTVNGQQSNNLLLLNADGTFDSTVYNLDSEVLGLALDNEGRLLVGGRFTVIGANGSGASRSYVARLTGGRTPFDFDGDGRTDLGVYRPSTGTWYLQRSSAGEFIQVFGINGDQVAAEDYDGDGKTDLAVFRNGDWWYLNSSTGTIALRSRGASGDRALPSDFDADGKADFVYYRPATGEWFRTGSAGANSTIQFGMAGDIPLVADMDGDGKTDPTIYRPSSGTFWYRSSVNGADTPVQWGQNGDVPVPADYDGDGKTDAAVFRPANGAWYVLNSGSGSFTVTSWGMNGDRPVAGDYDGDGRADVAIWRPSNGVWFILQSTAGFTGRQYGISTDTALENAYLP